MKNQSNRLLFIPDFSFVKNQSYESILAQDPVTRNKETSLAEFKYYNMILIFLSIQSPKMLRRIAFGCIFLHSAANGYLLSLQLQGKVSVKTLSGGEILEVDRERTVEEVQQEIGILKNVDPGAVQLVPHGNEAPIVSGTIGDGIADADHLQVAFTGPTVVFHLTPVQSRYSGSTLRGEYDLVFYSGRVTGYDLERKLQEARKAEGHELVTINDISSGGDTMWYNHNVPGNWEINWAEQKNPGEDGKIHATYRGL